MYVLHALLHIVHIIMYHWAMTVQATVKVKDIVHTIHQFEHEHHLCIAHTLEGTHTACPVKACSLVYTLVASNKNHINFQLYTSSLNTTCSVYVTYNAQYIICTLLYGHRLHAQLHIVHIIMYHWAMPVHMGYCWRASPTQCTNSSMNNTYA